MLVELSEKNLLPFLILLDDSRSKLNSAISICTVFSLIMVSKTKKMLELLRFYCIFFAKLVDKVQNLILLEIEFMNEIFDFVEFPFEIRNKLFSCDVLIEGDISINGSDAKSRNTFGIVMSLLNDVKNFRVFFALDRFL